jgi:23S rRNA (adenine2030-N6)-methyltransferase
MTRYPGSPELARRLLRADDCLIVNELHPAEAKLLRRWAAVDTKIRVHQRDAVEAVKALLPPRVRRGIVLIDPPYEVKTEYDSIAAALPAAVAR